LGWRGRIRGIRFEGGLPWDEFTIVTARDVPAPNRIALILDDQPCLADAVINHAEELCGGRRPGASRARV